jgi:GTP-binding protein
VPLGTQIFDTNTGELLQDLATEDARWLAAKGGRGGFGNSHFTTSTNRAPRYHQSGSEGEELELQLELKLLADVGLVGFPNAGKSTFISKVSAAKPKIADYPFTTLEPNLGVASFDGREMVLADIPGLIEGAASGKGLGHEFLRHVERARVLVILLDPSPLQEQSPAEQLEILGREIAEHSSDLAARPRVVLLNKADLGDMRELGASLGALPVSAMSGEGVREALHAIADLVEEAERVAPQRRGFVLHRPLGPTFTVRQEGDAWRVEGLAAERAVGFADLTLPEAADLAASRLSRLGVDQALLELGAVEGDEVRIGEISFEFIPERSFEEE